MKTTLVSKENNEAKLTIDFTAEEFEDAINKVYRKNRNQFVINGFRKGKAPRSIVEKHYGEGIFFEDAINNMLGEAYPQALQELDLDVIDSPSVDFTELAAKKPFTVTCTVALFPVIEVKDYKGVDVEQTESEVGEEEVDKDIESLRKRNARMAVVERPVQDGDTVLLDYAGFVGEDQFDGGTAERQELKIGSGTFIPGFEDQLVGAETGEKRDVNVTFPEDYGEKSLAGKDAVFHCTVHEIKEEQLPELDDEFAKDVSEYDTLEELRAHTKEDLQKTVDEQYLNTAKDAVVDKVYEANSFDVPKALVEDEIDVMARDLDQQLAYQGLSLDQYLKFTGSSMQQFRDQIRDDAEKRAGTRVVLLSIADAENMEVSDEELDEQYGKMAEQYGMEKDRLKEIMGDSDRVMKKDLLVTKVIDMLYDNANVTKVAPKPVEPEVTEVEKEDAEAEESADTQE